MKLQVVIREAEEGRYWAEVPSIPGCATQGDSLEELLFSLYEAVEGCLSMEVLEVPVSDTDRVIESLCEGSPRQGVFALLELRG